MRNNGVSAKTQGRNPRLFWVYGIVACSAIVIVFSLFSINPFGSGQKKYAEGPPKTKEEAIERVNRDTDEDGLKDWEEKIYGTNLEKPDTDADGTKDGEEIKLSRNPLIAGPDDKLAIPLPVPEDGNLTNALANEFIGRSITQVLADGLTKGVLPKDLSDLPSLEAHLAKLEKENVLDRVIRPDKREFAISQDNSLDAVKKYFNTVAEIYRKNLSIDSDLTILQLAAQGNNIKVFRRLDVNVAALSKTIEEVKKTPTPSKWLTFAIDDVWYISKTLAAVKILRNSETDPVSSMLVLSGRAQILDDLTGLYINTRTDLAAAGVTFKSGEPAAWLLKQE